MPGLEEVYRGYMAFRVLTVNVRSHNPIQAPKSTNLVIILFSASYRTNWVPLALNLHLGLRFEGFSAYKVQGLGLMI